MTRQSFFFPARSEQNMIFSPDEGSTPSQTVRFPFCVERRIDLTIHVNQSCFLGRRPIYLCEVFLNNRRILGSCFYSLVLTRVVFKSRFTSGESPPGIDDIDVIPREPGEHLCSHPAKLQGDFSQTSHLSFYR